VNITDRRYKGFALVDEMLETSRVVGQLSVPDIQSVNEAVKYQDVLLTGEGSSRIFPAKKTIYDAHRLRYNERIYSDAATQALEYDLSLTTVFVASNSGRTNECVRLINELKSRGHDSIVGVVANDRTPVIQLADRGCLLTCRRENAVAATKSVVEQALFYDILFRTRNSRPVPNLARLSELLQETMRAAVPPSMIEAMAAAGTVYFAGRNDGVAEELTLKTNEITRKKSDFLEGTYAVHGIEEVMDRGDVVIIIDPFPEEEAKFSEVLEKGVGMKVFAISSRESRFPTLSVPHMSEFGSYIQLVAGWSLLVEAGIELSINLDRPVRARKVGNEYPGR